MTRTQFRLKVHLNVISGFSSNAYIETQPNIAGKRDGNDLEEFEDATDEKRAWSNKNRLWGKRGMVSELEDLDEDGDDALNGEKRGWSNNQMRVWGTITHQ